MTTMRLMRFSCPSCTTPLGLPVEDDETYQVHCPLCEAEIRVSILPLNHIASSRGKCGVCEKPFDDHRMLNDTPICP